MQLQVDGEGLVPDMFRNISRSLTEDENVTEETPEFDPASCLPNPLPPDINKYYKISTLHHFGATPSPYILLLTRFPLSGADVPRLADGVHGAPGTAPQTYHPQHVLP